MSVACQTRCTCGISFNPHHKPGTQLLYYNTGMNPHTIQPGEAGGSPSSGRTLMPPCSAVVWHLHVWVVLWTWMWCRLSGGRRISSECPVFRIAFQKEKRWVLNYSEHLLHLFLWGAFWNKFFNFHFYHSRAVRSWGSGAQALGRAGLDGKTAPVQQGRSRQALQLPQPQLPPGESEVNKSHAVRLWREFT